MVLRLALIPLCVLLAERASLSVVAGWSAQFESHQHMLQADEAPLGKDQVLFVASGAPQFK